MKQLISLSVFSLLFAVCTAQADFQFNNITASDMEKLTSDLSANFAFTSIAPAAPLGKVFGFEFGALAGVASTPQLDSLSKSAGGGSVSSLANLMLLGRLSVPYGFTAEMGVFPKLNAGGASLSSNSFALAWSLTDSVLPGWLVDLGLKVHYTDSKFSLSQTSPTTTTIDISDKITGYQLFVSKNLIFMQPYAGVGSVTGAGTMDLTGTNIFNPAFTTSNSASASVTGSHLTLGTEFKMGFFKIALEYASLMGTSRYTGKMSFYF